MNAAELDEIPQPATSLAQIAASQIDRTQVLMNSIDSVIHSIRTFEPGSVESLIVEFERFDAFRGLPVEVTIGENIVAGINRGITSSGQLQLETKHGIEIHSAAEISLRLVTE